MDFPTGFHPLYRQVYDYLVKRIATGTWAPGDSIPSEIGLAKELGVSQGTVRKALNTMAAEGLIERRQGIGTFVSEHTPESSLFRFFRLAWPDGNRITPESGRATVSRRTGTDEESEKLQLRKGSTIIEIRRTRSVDGQPIISERIILPHKLFPGIDRLADLPNTLYSLYQRNYGINIVRAKEQLWADIATAEDVEHLPLSPGDPILHISRVAVALDGTCVEWRISRCDTSNLVYAVDIS